METKKQTTKHLPDLESTVGYVHTVRAIKQKIGQSAIVLPTLSMARQKMTGGLYALSHTRLAHCGC